MDTLELGAKIRTYRKSKGLAVKALAEQINVSPSLLSQIERDVANPSINTLKLISNALGVPLFQFFTSTLPAEDIVVRKNARKKMLFGTTPSLEFELLTPDTSGSIEFLFLKLKPFSDSGSAVEHHEGEEVAYVIKGTLTVKFDETNVTLNPGDSIRIPPMTPHLWSNDTGEEGEIIFAITPPSF